MLSQWRASIFRRSSTIMPRIERRRGIISFFCKITKILSNPHIFTQNTKLNFQVVGIDIAGDEGAIRSSGDSEVFTDFDKEIFRKAKNLGIHRTVHAGEDGPSANVKVAVEEMFAERIGELKITKYIQTSIQ